MRNLKLATARIHRAVKDANNPWSSISRTIMNDERLQPFDCQLLLYILNKPEDWTPRRSDLKRAMSRGGERCGDTRIRSSLARLRLAGYYRVVREQDCAGRFIRSGMEFSESPRADWASDRNADKPHVGSTACRLTRMLNYDR